MLHQARAPHRGGQAATAQRRILLVDEDMTLVESLSVQLVGQGFETHMASSGREALEEIEHWQPHLALVDLRLPEQDGFSLSRHLTENPSSISLPVILVSGMIRPDIVRCACRGGCRYYVRKPYDSNALLVLIEQAIAESESW